MKPSRIIIIGGGPAGVAAAGELARKNNQVILVEQFSSLGGVVFRHDFHNNSCSLIPKSISKCWKDLKQILFAHQHNISIKLNTTFIGMDCNGFVMLSERGSQQIETLQCDGLIVATGAVEKIRPVQGWNNSSVVTAGGLQVSVKTSKQALPGDTIIAGNGPLLFAIGAQLTKLGNPPKAIIDSGNPMRPTFSHFSLSLSYAFEGIQYINTLRKAKVPLYFNSQLKSIVNKGKQLEIARVDHSGTEYPLKTNILALHNGLTPNNHGIPDENTDLSFGTIVLHAGDCLEISGSLGAALNGMTKACQLINILNENPAQKIQYNKHLVIQQKLNRIFKPRQQFSLISLPNDTLLCRCEQKTIGDLKALCQRPNITAKEIKLNGRFTMGRCQGRFCEENVKTCMSEIGVSSINQLFRTNSRWPVKPINIRSLANLNSKLE